MAQVYGTQQMAAPTRAQSLKKLTNFLGAAISVGLVVGVGVWGYKLLVRDVSGVPVVRAAEGPMRVQPEDPGGEQALNQGLAVNDVAAVGAASDPADRLVLAPEPLELSLEDEPVANLRAAAEEEPDRATPTAEAGEPVPQPAEGEEALQLASVDALVARIVQDVEPIEGFEADAAEKAPKVEGGLGKSLRPHIRPAALQAGTAPAPTPASASAEVEASAIPVGTRLAQLGAFESAEIARSEWARLNGKFGEYLEGKQRVVQKAQSGGRTFYRLRAMGFADLSDARRFCSALVAENAECIPVVTR